MKPIKLSDFDGDEVICARAREGSPDAGGYIVAYPTDLEQTIFLPPLGDSITPMKYGRFVGVRMWYLESCRDGDMQIVTAQHIVDFYERVDPSEPGLIEAKRKAKNSLQEAGLARPA